MRKEIRENIEITIYTEAEARELNLSPCFVEGKCFSDYIARDDYMRVQHARAEREKRERIEALYRTPEEIAELKVKLEKLEDKLFYINKANKFDMVAYHRVNNEIQEIKEILRANA